MCLVSIADLCDEFRVAAVRVLKNFIKSVVKAQKSAKGFLVVTEIFRKNEADMTAGIAGANSKFAEGN